MNIPLHIGPAQAARKRRNEMALSLQRAGHHLSFRRERGFTLAEAVVVIVITGIISAIVAVFIRKPVEGYVEAVARAEVTDVADSALRRIARDVRLALPNSVRISADRRTMELLLTKTGGRYLAEEDNQAGADILSFTDTSDLTFRIVGNAPGSVPAAPEQVITAGDSIVVYNLGPGFAPADAYAGGNRAIVNSIAGAANATTVTLNANTFAQNSALTSPSRRFQVVSTPVTYYCDSKAAGGSGELRRYWGYTIQATQPTAAGFPSSTSNALLATGVQDCVFDYANLANIHSGLVGLNITMAPTTASGIVQLVHQIHVDNTP